MTEQDALLILNAIDGMGNARIRGVLERYGTAVNVLSCSGPELATNRFIPPKVIQNILHFPKDNFLKSEYNLMIKKGVDVVTYKDDRYPLMLREIPDAPIVLYVKGKLPADMGLSLAIVGSRRASVYGISTARQLSVQLSELGITVVSGMARGIDTSAHKGVVTTGGQTIAVLGCGLSHIYPPENKRLLEEIAVSGAVISEFAMETLPLAFNFPRRNRIISGLSLGVIVIEAAQRSGALITADCALEQGREVFAVPGRIDQAVSSGVNNLIKQGAKLLTSIEDILQDLEPHLAQGLNKDISDRSCQDRKTVKEKKETRLPDLSEREKEIYSCMSDRPIHIDELMKKPNIKSQPVMSVLLQLELKQLVKQMPGKLFVKRSKGA